MKVRISRAELAEAAAWVAQAVQKIPTHPVMAGLRITATDHAVTVAAFNYETAHTATIDADVLEPGEALVSAKFAVQILNALKVKQVELVADDTRLTINAGRSAYKVALMRVDDYPNMPKQPINVARIDAAELVATIGRVEHAAARDAGLDILTAINLVGDGERVTAVATDRYRIARASAPCPGAPFVANVPATAIASAVKALDGPVEIGCSDGVLSLADGSRSIVTRLIEKDHTKVDAFFAPTNGLTISFPAAEFVEAVKRAVLVITDRAKDTLSVYVDAANGELRISADSDTGEGAEYLACEAQGDPIEVFVGAQHLIQPLSLLGDTEACIRFREPTKPAVISPANDDTYGFVVLPRRTL